MIHSSASFTFFKKSKSLREEVSSRCDSEKSINRPTYSYIDYMRNDARNQHIIQAHSLHYTERHAKSHIAPTRRATNLSLIIRAIFLYYMRAPVNIYISANYLIPRWTGWTRKKPKIASRRPMNSQSSSETEREENSRETSKNYKQISKCGNGHHTLTMLLMGGSLWTPKKKRKKHLAKRTY